MATEETKKKTVELSQEMLDALMQRLEDEEKKLKELESVQDKKTQNKIEELRRNGKLVKNVKVRMLNNLEVIGWKTLVDDVYFADGKLIEKQTVEVWLSDGGKQELTMRQWAAIPTYKDYEVIKETKNEDGDIYFVVRRDDGKEVEIGIMYVN